MLKKIILNSNLLRRSLVKFAVIGAIYITPTVFITALIGGHHHPLKHRLPLTFTTRAGFKWHLWALVSQKGTMTMTMTTGSERLIWRFPSTGPGEQYMENSLCTATSCFLSFPSPPPPAPPPPGAHQQHSQQQQQEHLDIFTSARC